MKLRNRRDEKKMNKNEKWNKNIGRKKVKEIEIKERRN